MTSRSEPITPESPIDRRAPEQRATGPSPTSDSFITERRDDAGNGLQAPATVGEPGSRAKRWLFGALGLIVMCVVALLLASRSGNAGHAANLTDAKRSLIANDAVGLPVNTIQPRQKTLERSLAQPGHIKPWAQAELYAKASGYLKTIRRAPTPQLAADLLAQRLCAAGSPIASAACLASRIEIAMLQAPQIDIGSRVSAGDLLIEIDCPELLQAVVEKSSFVQQRQAELDAARMALGTFESAVEAARAQIVQIAADVRKCESEHLFRSQELKRLKDLGRSRVISEEIGEEKQHQVNAALAAWESSRAKVLSAQADLAVVSSKLIAARADIKVKEVLVQVAKDELRRAGVLAEYSQLRAPFDGIITYRGVDEGDFVQNATSGQARRLLTVTALDKVKVVLQVPEKDAPWVRVGAEGRIVLDARLGKEARGRVARTANTLDSQTLTLQAEIDLDNQDRSLLPEMYGQVTLTLERIPNAQAIPATALYSRKGENFILQVKDGIARRQRVRVRFDDGKEVEVVKQVNGKEIPLDGSEEIVVSNKGEIADGQHVRSTHLSID